MQIDLRYTDNIYLERKGNPMINYDEEIKKFSPSLEVDETEDEIGRAHV